MTVLSNDFKSTFGSIKSLVRAVGGDAGDIGHGNPNWKQDVCERSPQVYGYWRMLPNKGNYSDLFFLNASKLVAIAQVSSTVIE